MVHYDEISSSPSCKAGCPLCKTCPKMTSKKIYFSQFSLSITNPLEQSSGMRTLGIDWIDTKVVPVNAINNGNSQGRSILVYWGK